MKADHDNRNPLLFFAEHLLLCQKTIVVSQDILLDSGEVVVRKGEEFCRETLKQLEVPDKTPDFLCAISTGDALTSRGLLADFKSWINNDQALAEFAERYTDWSEIQRFCDQVADYDDLMLQLTVMKSQLPLIYQQALFTAWLGCALIKQVQRASRDAFNAFFLALTHDVGLLYVPLDYAKSRHQLTVKQLKGLQAHAVIGFSVLKRVTNLPEDVLKAVIEHHENLDGTGYPAGKVGNTISRLGQLINFLDAINAIYTKRLKPGRRPLRDLIPIIQMNGHSRYGIVGKKIIEWLKEMPEPTARAVPNVLMPLFIEAVRDRHAYITGCVYIIQQLSKDVGYRHGDQRVFALQNAIIHINVALTQSGIINSAYMRWLDQVEAESLTHVYREIEDVFLMMQEVIYHIEKLKCQMESFLEKPCSGNETYILRKGLERLSRITLPKIHSNLEILWITNTH